MWTCCLRWFAPSALAASTFARSAPTLVNMLTAACQLLFATLAAADTPYAWESAASTYYTTSELPGDASSCCGSQRVGDPVYNVDASICECDATAGVCDPSCCCDQDCSEFETMTVTALHACHHRPLLLRALAERTLACVRCDAGLRVRE